MSKKKRRYTKYPKRRPSYAGMSGGKDTHHLCYQRKLWHGEALVALRDYWYCKAEVPKNTLHRRIHALVPIVPVPKAVNAKSALAQLRTLERYEVIHEEDTIERKLEVLIALFDYVEQPTADAFKKQLDVVRKFYTKPSQ